jgi:hypothetical protein
MVRNSTIANNNIGLFVAGSGGSMSVTRSTITGNGNGWVIGSGGPTSFSYDDNNVVGGVSGTPSLIGYK